jgi:phosphatidylserine decarboxylase
VQTHLNFSVRARRARPESTGQWKIGFSQTQGRRVSQRHAQRFEDVVQGERISLVQFGSRGDVYLPLEAKIQCKLGDKVVGGETVLATLE